MDRTDTTAPTNSPVMLPEGLVAEMPRHIAHAAFIESVREAEGDHPIVFAKLDTRGIGVIGGRMDPGHVSERHRHTHEAVMIILEGEGSSEVEGDMIPWKAGDVFVIPAWAWHRHHNGAGASLYLACDTLPVMRSFGILAKQADH